MKIVICGSFTEINLFRYIRSNLERLGHNVLMPKEEHFNTYYFKNKKVEGCEAYLKAIDECDGIIVVNEKNGEEYLGISTAREVGYAHAKGKTIYITHPTNIPDLIVVGARVIEI
jgi:nucleoside 2-deoxyribosyltransferase